MIVTMFMSAVSFWLTISTVAATVASARMEIHLVQGVCSTERKGLFALLIATNSIGNKTAVTTFFLSSFCLRSYATYVKWIEKFGVE